MVVVKKIIPHYIPSPPDYKLWMFPKIFFFIYSFPQFTFFITPDPPSPP